MGKKEILCGKIKNIRRDQWIVLLLAGILFVVISMPAAGGTTEGVPADTKETQIQLPEDDMEERLETILSQMEGAGSVRVMITYQDKGEKIVEKDTPSVNRTTQEESGGRSTVEIEQDEATVYEKDNSGGEIPYVTQERSPQVEGVLVLAQGADSAVVKKEITDAVMALFGLEAHKIKVMKMNERRG